MSTAKTRVPTAELRDFFNWHLGLPDAQYETIEEGETSQAYFFDDSEGPRVLRINSSMQEGFLKDKFAAEHFAKDDLPIPRTYEVGEVSPGIYFSITERAQGKLLNQFNVEETDAMMAEIIRTATLIHDTPPVGLGYGWWDPAGQGRFANWPDAVRAMQTAPDDHKLHDVAFFDQAIHDDLQGDIERLIPYCPAERSLLHGDYGFKNTLADGQKITGVIDWQSSMYGDPLYDVAWLEFWRKEQRFAEQFREYYASMNREMKHFNERIRCYSLLTALSSMAFFAKSGQPDKYDFSKQRLQTL